MSPHCGGHRGPWSSPKISHHRYKVSLFVFPENGQTVPKKWYFSQLDVFSGTRCPKVSSCPYWDKVSWKECYFSQKNYIHQTVVFSENYPLSDKVSLTQKDNLQNVVPTTSSTSSNVSTRTWCHWNNMFSKFSPKTIVYSKRKSLLLIHFVPRCQQKVPEPLTS